MKHTTITKGIEDAENMPRILSGTEFDFNNNIPKYDTVNIGTIKDGPKANLIGINGDMSIKFVYGPNAYIEKINEPLKISSLYTYQLERRLGINKSN